MARLYLVRLTDDSSKALFSVNETAIAEVAAGIAFVVLMLAVLFGPYVLGCLPEVEAELARGLR
ncbi:MAG: hypothetical protein AB3N22_11515 [Ruegeria sp.]